jgi:uracil-DNA glycosylase
MARTKLDELRRQAAGCTACDLYKTATQVVFGEGPEAVDAGIDREQVYLTNVVKHFKWVARGKRRIHQKPKWSEVAACRPWLEAELEVVQPRVLVCLGAVAAQTLLGREVRVSRERGIELPSDLAEHVLATVHPSSILRGDPVTREREYDALVGDLGVVANWL